MNALLLGQCVCGEPVFRHRTPDNRQISCERLRQIDQALQMNGTRPEHALSAANVIHGDFERTTKGGR